MTDTVVKGSGNSRTLVTVPNALTIYPTHEELMTKWATEGIPVDIGPLVASGCDVIGTLLNKANLLPDSVESAIWGNAANRTVAQALHQLRSLITTAQNAAAGRLRAEIGTYTGVQEVDTSHNPPRPSKTLTFTLDPVIVVVMPNSHTIANQNPTLSPLLMLQGIDMVQMPYRDNSYIYFTKINVSFGTKSVTWDSNVPHEYYLLNPTFNVAGVVYTWIAIGK